MAKTLLPAQDSNTNGKLLKSNGTDASWEEASLTATNIDYTDTNSSLGDATDVQAALDSAGTQLAGVDTKIATHDTSETAHADIRAELEDKANKVQEDWITPTLLNGYENYGSPFANVSYFKDEFGFVHLKGVAKLSVEKTSNTLFVLPNGYRAPKLCYLPYLAGDSFYTLSLTATGNVNIYSTSKLNWISLNGISFKVEG